MCVRSRTLKRISYKIYFGLRMYVDSRTRVATRNLMGGVWSSRDGTSGGFFLCPFSSILAAAMDILTFVPPGTAGVTSTLLRRPTTGDDPLQAPHHIWIALQRSVMQCIYRCFGKDVLYNLILGAVINLLECSDSVIIEFVLDVITIERATTLLF